MNHSEQLAFLKDAARQVIVAFYQNDAVALKGTVAYLTRCVESIDSPAPAGDK